MVATAKHLNNVRDYMDAHFKQIQSIGLRGVDWEPIGSINNMFTGSYNGNGKEIINLLSDKPSEKGQGVFGYTSKNARLFDIEVTSFSVKGDSLVGALVGYNIGTITNCKVISSKVYGKQSVGGLVGYNRGIIDGCTSSAQVSGVQDLGGLVGTNAEGTIKNSYVYAVGRADGTENVGGLVGLNNLKGRIENCYTDYYVVLSGIRNVGGLVGLNNADIYDSHTKGMESVISHVTVNDKEVSMGGLVGHNTGNINNCYTKDAAPVGSYKGGGLVGHNTGNINKSYAVDAMVYGRDIRGGDYRSAGRNNGGLVGQNDGNITDSYARGEVTAFNIVGGLVGTNKGTIKNSYAAVKVNYIKNPYQEKAHHGGFVGLNDGGKVENSFFDKDIATTSAGKGNSKTTEDMKKQATFGNWDFINVWMINSNSYPSLR